MRNLFQKTWFKGVLIMALLVIVFLMNLWIMSNGLINDYADTKRDLCLFCGGKLHKDSYKGFY